jgi:hypothetical protein
LARKFVAPQTRIWGGSSTSSWIEPDKVRAAVVDFGGFLGVGSRKIAIGWNALHFAINGNKLERVTLEWTRDQVRASPEYRDDKPVVVLEAASNLEPLTFP